MKLSVIIPVYNGRLYLRSAVQSVLAEKVDDIEILIIDDGSTDGSLQTVEDFPVKCFRFAENRGPAFARNQGVRLAEGEYITFLDSDDLMIPGGLSWRVNLLRNHSEWPAVAGIMGNVIDSQGFRIGSYQELINPYFKLLLPKLLNLDFLRNGGQFGFYLAQYIFSRAGVAETGPFDESLGYADDFDFILRFLKTSALPCFAKPTFDYRVHGKNLASILGEKGVEFRKQARVEGWLVAHQHGVASLVCANLQ